MTEIWKPIDGFEGHEVSNFGRVRSLDREITVQSGHHTTRKYRGVVLAQSTDEEGYRRVCLNKDNQQHGRIVHRLVLEAFVRKMNADEEGNHLDFNKANNCLYNLKITTTEGNMAHATNGQPAG